MPHVAPLIDQALSAQIQAQIAALPRKAGAVDCAPRGTETSATLHYSGVRYARRDQASELRALVNEAAEHLRRNWGQKERPPIYAQRYMYDLVVLSDGTIVQPNARPLELWHCGNGTGNATSWSVHVLLGPDQDLTIPQHESLVALFGVLADASGFDPAALYGHHEWPRGDGPARPSATYRRFAGQSICPGPVLHAHLATYRANAAARRYSTASPLLGTGQATFAQIVAYLTPSPHYNEADVQLIATEYVGLCALTGLNHDLVIGQLAHETGRLTSWWCARPRRNGAGLGVTGHIARWSDDLDPRFWSYRDGQAAHGMAFTAWRDADAPDGEGSISHHVGRLLAYALPIGPTTIARHALITRALAMRPLPNDFRGKAVRLDGLNARWAYPGLRYVDGIVRHANALVAV